MEFPLIYTVFLQGEVDGDSLEMFSIIIIICLFVFSRAAPTAYGGSQARGPIGAVAAGLDHSHSNMGSKPHRQPTPQLMAMPDP